VARKHKGGDGTARKPKSEEPTEPLPGTAGMAQGQPAAGIEPDEYPEQAAGPVTGAEQAEVAPEREARERRDRAQER
jgi:hypothetical protein